MERYTIVDNFQTFIDSDWDTIRRFQNVVTEVDLSEYKNRMPIECCGILFHNKKAIATNGHWSISAKCYGEYNSGKFFFYDYNLDDIKIDHNPFEVIGLNIKSIRQLFSKWNPLIIKLNIKQIIDFILETYKTIKEQRRVEFYCKVVSSDSAFIKLTDRDGEVHYIYLPLWKNNEVAVGESFSVNCGYLIKLLKIIQDMDYPIVDFCFDSDDSPVVIKAKEEREHSLPIKIALGQFFLR